MNSRIISWALASIVGPMIAITAQAQLQSPLEAIHEGHWLEIHGQLLDDGTFEAQEVELIHSQRYEELTGTVAEQDAKAGTISLLGQEVELTDKTTFDRVARNELEHSRVKVKGYYLGSKRFSARRVRPRGEGRDKLVGRVDQVRKSDEGLLINLMSFSVRIAADSPVMHQESLVNYELSDARTKILSSAAHDEDDSFGAGIRISDTLRMAGQIEGKWTGEDEFDLNERRARDREDTEGRIRARFTYRPSDSFIGVLDLTYDQLWRDDDADGYETQGDLALAETFGYWIDPLQWDTDFQVGRMDFDDEREWLYDQNLTAPAFFILAALWQPNCQSQPHCQMAALAMRTRSTACCMFPTAVRTDPWQDTLSTATPISPWMNNKLMWACARMETGCRTITAGWKFLTCLVTQALQT
jgi:hypothetical protein